jgi:ATP-dependent DNA ligase
VAAGRAEATAAETDSVSANAAAVHVDHIEARGRDFFEVACAHDLECIVGKLASGRYHADGTSTNWIKFKNPGYTQMTARHELFDTRPSTRRSARVLAP